MLCMRDLQYPGIDAKAIKLSLPESLVASSWIMGDRLEPLANTSDRILPAGTIISLIQTEYYRLVIHKGGIWCY